MPRRRDVLCAGGCGRLIWRGTGCLPPGQATCRPCRGNVPSNKGRREQVCPICQRQFRPSGGYRQVCCSMACSSVRRKGRLVEITCASCGETDRRAPGTTRYCAPCAKLAERTRNRRKNVKRRALAAAGPTLTLWQLASRDQWRCHLCRRRVNMELTSPHPRSATVDHLVPVSDGGTDAPENIRLAHRTCNTKRGTRGTVQLLLVG